MGTKRESDILQSRTILDQTLIRKGLGSIQHLQDNLALRVFVAGNLSEKTGKLVPENTMRFVWQAISQKLDGVTHWLDDPWFESATFEEKMENEEVPEGVIVLENLNF